MPITLKSLNPPKLASATIPACVAEPFSPEANEENKSIEVCAVVASVPATFKAAPMLPKLKFLRSFKAVSRADYDELKTFIMQVRNPLAHGVQYDRTRLTECFCCCTHFITKYDEFIINCKSVFLARKLSN